jgi:cell division septum initiation protein DivIVA
VTETQIKDRLKAVLNGSTPDTATSEHPLIVPGAMHPNQALQVLTLAQRTAEEHIAIANRQAEKIRADAQAAADQIAKDAEAHSKNIRKEADRVLAEARAAAEKAAREAQAQAEETRRNAEKIVSEARDQAQKITGDAQEHAEQLKLQAQQRYEDAVGSLGSKREALQQQIESLEEFDREYRARLTTFMQGQLRALWVDVPVVGDELGAPAEEPAADEAETGE